MKNYPGTETEFSLMFIWFFIWNQLGFQGHSKHLTEKLTEKHLGRSLRIRCFPIIFGTFLRRSFLQNTSEWLLVVICLFSLSEGANQNQQNYLGKRLKLKKREHPRPNYVFSSDWKKMAYSPRRTEILQYKIISIDVHKFQHYHFIIGLILFTSINPHIKINQILFCKVNSQLRCWT